MGARIAGKARQTGPEEGTAGAERGNSPNLGAEGNGGDGSGQIRGETELPNERGKNGVEIGGTGVYLVKTGANYKRKERSGGSEKTDIPRGEMNVELGSECSQRQK